MRVCFSLHVVYKLENYHNPGIFTSVTVYTIACMLFLFWGVAVLFLISHFSPPSQTWLTLCFKDLVHVSPC